MTSWLTEHLTLETSSCDTCQNVHEFRLRHMLGTMETPTQKRCVCVCVCVCVSSPGNHIQGELYIPD